jgi:hypothetical protein
MRWLKHLTAAHRDERLAAFLDEYGLEGYGFWWLLLEVVGHAVKGDQCEVTYSLPQWSRLLYSHHHRVSKYMGSLHRSGLVIAENVDGKWRVSVPNLLKYRDEYARKSGQASGSTPDTPPDIVRHQKQKQKQKTETTKKTPSSSPKKLELPFVVPDSDRNSIAAECPGLDLERETRKFVDWAKNGKRKIDWVATWRNWMRKAWEDNPTLRRRSPGSGTLPGFTA